MYNDYYYDDYDYKTSKNKFSLSNLNLKNKLIIGLVLLIVLIVVIIIINSIKNYLASYEYLEKQMILEAKDYINENNLVLTNEIYLDVTKLGIDVKKNCTLMSGVFVDRNYNYKAYLDCDDYQSEVINNDNKSVSLNGDDVIILGKDVKYNELGTTGNYRVSVQGEVGNAEGVYTLKYFIYGNNTIVDILERKVVVLWGNYITNLYPTLLLNGDDVEYVQEGHKYEDKGVSASDLVDLNLENKIKKSGNVNINRVGEYELTYSVTNSRGYSNSVTRKIIVVNNFSTTTITSYITPETITGTDVTINLKIIGDQYEYMILPDGSRTSRKTVEYPVSENGTYNFIGYDNDGKSVTKVINVENIDKTKPNASCNAYVYRDYVHIYVSPYSGKKIKTYNYKINQLSSGEIETNNYKYNVNDVNNVDVIIKDDIGNSNIIVCELIDKKKPVYVTNRCTDDYIYEGTKYPLTQQQKQKLAAMIISEYGSDIVGMKAVASHMANLYEYKKWANHKDVKGSFFETISTTPWYSSGTRSDTYYNDMALQAVEECIVNGHRTLPLYINEFDWYPGDVVNPLGVDDYVRDITNVRNVYGASGTFWCMSQNSRKTDANIYFYINEKYRSLFPD